MSERRVDRLVVAAPAKVNLFLHVTGRRPDGYHRIESLFALIDLADTLTLELRGDQAIARARDVPGVDAREDLALRAASALREAAGVRRGVTIDVVKRIPIGGGLGGGSSDAASVLVALNRLWRTGLARDDLARIGAELGADVPFFVHGENAIVRGIGEVVKAVSLPRTWIALAMPPVHVSTAAVFSDPALTRSDPSAKIDVFSESYGRNTLESVAAARYPDVANALAALRRARSGARMTGSGSCIIAACASADEANDALSGLPVGTAGRVVRTLARHPLASLM